MVGGPRMTHPTPGAADPMFDVSGRTVVMTGGSGVLGRVIARGLAARGANLVRIIGTIRSRIVAGGGGRSDRQQ